MGRVLDRVIELGWLPYEFIGDHTLLAQIDPRIELHDFLISCYVSSCCVGLTDGIDGFLCDDDDTERVTRICEAYRKYDESFNGSNL